MTSPANIAAQAERDRESAYWAMARVRGMPRFQRCQPRIDGRIVLASDDTETVFMGDN
jgi:hypothetical protein